LRKFIGRGGAVGLPYRVALSTGANVELRPWRIPALLLGAALAGIATLVLASSLAATAPGVHAPFSRDRAHSIATPLPASLAPSASASIGASDGRYWPIRRGDALLAQGGGINSAFSISGAQLRVARGTLALSMESFGRDGLLAPVKPAAPSATGSQILYRHGSISEFYRNGPYGLEQGFTVPRSPHAGSGSLVIALHLDGSLVPHQAGSQILFTAPSGAVALRYGDLSARDATGRLVPAQMQVRGRTLLLRVDDSHARYPLRIDPFFQQGPKLTGGSEIGSGQFGYSVALSSDGNTALIGGRIDNAEIGAAWVFTRSGSTWTQQGGKLTGANEVGPGQFGYSVALSSDGNTALIGGRLDNAEIGAAWVFTRSESTWTQQGSKLTGGGEQIGLAQFGYRVALSGDGNTALIGGPRDHALKGAAWVFTRNTESKWTQQGPKLTGVSGEEAEGEFGEAVALSSTDGNTALIGGSNDKVGVGAAWVFTRLESKWTQQAELKGGTEEKGTGHFGFSAALSSDGNTALIGGSGDNSEVGAAWVFTRTESTWTQQGPKLTGSGEVGKGHFGFSVALSSDGNTALIGGGGDNGEVGAAWVFTRSGSTWTQEGSKLTGGEESGKAHFGWSVALSADAATALVGGLADNNSAGAAWPFSTTQPPATVTSITPTSGPTTGGTAVKIKGTGFVAPATVTIGSAATAVNVVSATEITASTAATAAGSNTVIVSDVNGTSSGGPSYTYVTPPGPTVTGISPTSGTTLGGTKVSITGTGFVSGATVTIGTAATSVTVSSATKITAKTAATAAGSDEVVVTDTNGTSTGGPSYTYVTPAPPKVTSISPTSGTYAGGTKVSITGTGFVAGATVTIGNAATSVKVSSATKITAKTAATPVGSDEVVVTDAGGTSTGGPLYTYFIPPPKVKSITPTSGPTAGGTKVVILGTGFVAGATVTIGNAPTSVAVLSSTKITATTAATAAGSDEVVVTDANGTSTGGPKYTYIPPPPTVTSITPTSGSTAGGTAVTIKGTGFLAGASVKIGTAAIEVFVVSETELTATTSATAAGSYEVIVTDAKGISPGGPSFKYE
jgi:IPT/TIG domain/FG-GAP repeat